MTPQEEAAYVEGRRSAFVSTTYSAEVFYGAFVALDTPLGRKLDGIIDDYGGTPAPVDEHPDIEIGSVGSHPTGKVWITVMVKGMTRVFRRGDEIVPPLPLEERLVIPASAVVAFLVSAGVAPKDLPVVGWHFAGSVS